ncbi:MAG: TauD/TfdA family dioxygenase [Burkholderiales bacterium]
MSGAFDIGDANAYAAWRERKLAYYPKSVSELVVEVGDPRSLSTAERQAILDRCRRANMAIYASGCGSDPDKEIPRRLGRQLGLEHLDPNYLADDDGISPLTVAGTGGRGEYIPYTSRGINWHTDGYYNRPERRVRAFVLHCVQSALEGGENLLLDHEIAYLLLRDGNPEHVRALQEADALTIPPRVESGRIERPAQSGAVFSVDSDGCLHMRYTARTVSISWKDSAAMRDAVAALERLLAGSSSYVFRARLEPGMGLVCNNILHNRSAFSDSPDRRRLIYRARYYERVTGTEDAGADPG